MKNLVMKSKALFLSLVMGSALLLTSCGGQSQGGSNLNIPGVDGPKISLVQDTVLISKKKEKNLKENFINKNCREF